MIAEGPANMMGAVDHGSMQLTGVPSWSLRSGDSQRLYTALFLRDSLGLAPGSDPDVPPRVDPAVPDLSALIDDDTRNKAGIEWMPWWAALAGTEDLLGLPQEKMSPVELERSQRAGFNFFAGVSDFYDLATRPHLQVAFRAVELQAAKWYVAAAAPFRPPHGADPIPWADTRDAAENVAFDRNIPLDEVNGAVIYIPVGQPWWHLIRPHVALCSTAIATDPGQRAAVLRAVLDPHASARFDRT